MFVEYKTKKTPLNRKIEWIPLNFALKPILASFSTQNWIRNLTQVRHYLKSVENNSPEVQLQCRPSWFIGLIWFGLTEGSGVRRRTERRVDGTSLLSGGCGVAGWRGGTQSIGARYDRGATRLKALCLEQGFRHRARTWRGMEEKNVESMWCVVFTQSLASLGIFLVEETYMGGIWTMLDLEEIKNDSTGNIRK